MSLSTKIIFTSKSRHVIASVNYFSQRECSSKNIKVIENPSLPSLKRGTGGRSSFSGTVATVFGATGFLGGYLVNALGKCGSQVIIPYRSEPDDYNVKKLKLCGDLGQILYQPFDLRDPLSIRKAIKYSNVVFNLIGTYVETRNFKMKDVNETGAREIAKACAEMNIPCLIHVSTLNVTENPKAYMFPKPLQYLPTKLKGERAVLEEFPDAIIFRPADMFGRYDRFLWALCYTNRKTLTSIPLWAGGKRTVKQPVFVQDVVDAMIVAMKNLECRGKIYQAVGPEKYLLSEIVDYCGRILYLTEGKYHHDARLDPLFLAKILTIRYGIGRLLYKPKYHMCFEQLDLEAISDEIDILLPTLEDLGIKPIPLESKAEHIVRAKSLSKSAHYRDLIKYVSIRPPKVYNPLFSM